MGLKEEFRQVAREAHDGRTPFEMACDMLFRGFVPTRSKRCLMKFKDVENLPTLNDIRQSDEFAGVLKEGVVLLDFDDRSQGDRMERMLDDCKVEYFRMETTRGVHFYFKCNDDLKATVGADLACGLSCDIKSGAKNGYAILKYEGREREVTKTTYKLGSLPVWAKPISKYSDLQFVGMKEGDGRNQALFRHVTDLVNNGMVERDVKLCIMLMNSYVFDQPLDKSELSTILRREAFPQDRRKAKEGTREDKSVDEAKGSFDVVKYGREAMDALHICVLNGTICGWNGKTYSSNRLEMNRWMYERWGAGMNVTRIREIWAFIESECSVAKDLGSEDARYIAFSNGVYDIVDCRLLDFDPQYHITNIIPHDYNEDAKCEALDRMLDRLSCGDADVRAVMEECIGYCFYRANELSKAFLFIGDRSNGKSTFLSLVKTLLGLDNISALDLSQMGERFSVASMVGKLANIGDDISDEFAKGATVAVFKKLVSGNLVQAEFKNQTPFVFIPTVKMLFSSNEMPRMKGSEEAVSRRMVIVPFNAKFSKDDPDYDPYIIYKVKTEEAMQYMIQLGLDGLWRVLENKGFTKCGKVDEMLREFDMQNDPMLEWLEDNPCSGRPIEDCYMQYRVWCEQSGCSPMARGKFTRRVCTKQGLASVVKRNKGAVKRCFS